MQEHVGHKAAFATKEEQVASCVSYGWSHGRLLALSTEATGSNPTSSKLAKTTPDVNFLKTPNPQIRQYYSRKCMASGIFHPSISRVEYG
jgi:hypothetical protein